MEIVRISELKPVQCRHLRQHGNLKRSIANEAQFDVRVSV